jgi:hypothetical protein
VLAFAVGSAVLVWLVINGFRVYVYSKNLDVDDKIVPSREGGGYDYSSPMVASERDYILYPPWDENSFGGFPISDYDYLYSDNYK